MLEKVEGLAIRLGCIGGFGAIGIALIKALVVYVQTKHGAVVALNALEVSMNIAIGLLALSAFIGYITYRKRYPQS